MNELIFFFNTVLVSGVVLGSIYAIGAIGEDGQVYFNPGVREELFVPDEYVETEKRHQLAEIARRKKLFRAVRPAAAMAGRSIFITRCANASPSARRM